MEVQFIVWGVLVDVGIKTEKLSRGKVYLTAHKVDEVYFYRNTGRLQKTLLVLVIDLKSIDYDTIQKT